MSSEKTLFSSVDLSKFLASLLVIAIHTHPFWCVNNDIDYYSTSFCRIAVPYFFISSSFLFFRKSNPDIKHYTKRLLILYAVWFLIELPIVYHRFFVAYERPLPFQIANFVRCLIFNNTWLASWYIMASILAVAIVYYLSKHLSNKWLLMIGCAAYLLSLSCSSYSGAVDLLLNERLRYYHALVSYLFMPANSFIVALLFIVLGKIVAERFNNNQKNNNTIVTDSSRSVMLLFLIISVLLWGIEVYMIKWSVSINDAFLALPFVTVCGFVLILNAKIHIEPETSRVLRYMSILVYILHPVLSLLNQRFCGMSYGLLLFSITLIESLFIAWLIVKLSPKLSFLKWLY